jgi:hypothetical protein
MGVQLPLPAPPLFLSKSFSSSYLRPVYLHGREERLSGFRYKNGYTAYRVHVEWFRGIIAYLWRSGDSFRFSYLRSIT